MTRDLYLIHGSPYAWRVQLALEHKGLPYTPRVLTFAALQDPVYQTKNPRGRVPTLDDDGFTVYESLAILAYLDRRYPQAPLFGAAAEDTATIWRVISEYTSYLDHAVEAFILPIYFGRAVEQAEQIRAAAATITTELAAYEQMLVRTSFLAGDAVTAADFVVFPHIQSILRAASKEAARSFELTFLPVADRHPAITRWMQRVEALPNYDRTYPPNWR